jgi:hypothetical protein
MKDQVVTLLEAVRLAREELKHYMEAGEQAKADPEISIAKLVAILDHAEVSRAIGLLSGVVESPPIVPAAGEPALVK